jgi:hypothetical protein
VRNVQIKLGLLKLMAQLVSHLELHYKSYGYISSIYTFPLSSVFMKIGGMKNVGEKSMSVENKWTSS